MTSLRPQPTEVAFSTSSNGSSSAQYTPVSDGSEEENVPSSSNRPPPGSLKLQTDLDSDDGRLSIAGSDEGYESYSDARRGSNQSSLPKYTTIEEREVVKKFDRKLVPFLALLYMLSFLDRSSKLPMSSLARTTASPRPLHIREGGVSNSSFRYWKCKDCRSYGRFEALFLAI